MRTKLEIALGRRRWRAKDAELVLAALAESGNTAAEFVRRHGLQPKRLQRWWERLAHLESPSLTLGDEPEVAPLLPVRVRGTDSVPPGSVNSPWPHCVLEFWPHLGCCCRLVPRGTWVRRRAGIGLAPPRPPTRPPPAPLPTLPDQLPPAPKPRRAQAPVPRNPRASQSSSATPSAPPPPGT
jgi:hypothetical protein